jgi:hypothetical protein
MAKTSAKPAAEKAKLKKAPAKTKVAKALIETAAEEAFAKLKALNAAHQLQAEIEWCLGSYRADHNPVGLYEVVSHALAVFKAELKKKTKGVTAKLVDDLEKALASK